MLMLCLTFLCDDCLCICRCLFFFFKQKTAYEMRISDWSSDVCSSDLRTGAFGIDAADFIHVAQITSNWPLAIPLFMGLCGCHGRFQRHAGGLPPFSGTWLDRAARALGRIAGRTESRRFDHRLFG